MTRTLKVLLLVLLAVGVALPTGYSTFIHSEREVVIGAHDATVQPCCMVMGTDRIALGNVDATPLVELWEGEDFRRFRSGLLNGRPNPVCQGCALYRGTF